MAKGSVSLRSVSSLAPQDREYVLWDTALKGFGVRVSPTGGKAFLFRYRPPNVPNKRIIPPKTVTLGRWGAVTPEQARTEAKRLAALVVQGVDPVEAAREQVSKQAAERAAAEKAAEAARLLQIQSLSIDFLNYILHASPASHEFCESTLRLHILPVIGLVKLDELTRTDVNNVLKRIAAKQVALRRNVFAVLRWLAAWAVDELDLRANPMAGMKPPPTVQARDRVLSDEEISWLWRAAETLPAPYPAFYKTLVLSAQRREEVAGMQWEELNRDRSEWTLPGARSKNGEANVVPIGAELRNILDGLANGDKWPRAGTIFASRANTPLTAFSQGKRLLDRAMETIASEAHGLDATISPWRIHDIRRTVATGLQRLGVRFEVTEAVLNHLSGSRSGVAGVYQRHGWKEEKRAALDAWASQVLKATKTVDHAPTIPTIRTNPKI